MSTALIETITTNVQTTTARPAPEMLDFVQVTKGVQNSIFELWNGCPEAQNYNGHHQGKPGFYIKVIESEAFTTKETYSDRENTYIQDAIIIDEDFGMEILEQIRQANEEFVTA